MRKLWVVSCLVWAMCDIGCGAQEPVGDGNGAAGEGATAGSGAAAGSSGAGTLAAGSGSMAGSGAGASGTAGVDPAVQNIFDSGCASASVKSDLLPSNILFVVDRSGSMTCNPPPTTTSTACEATPTRADTGMPSKWEITSGALIDAIKTLPADAIVGVSYFSNDDNCGVHSQPSVPLMENTAAQQSTVAASLMGVTPAGGTPIVGATILAYKHLHEAALAGSIFGNKFVVLITDGEQSEQCSDTLCDGAAECTTLLVDEEVPRAAAKGVGIRTFVIGVPGSEPARTVLSQMAQAGLTAADGCDPTKGDCHFDMTKETDLSTALTAALGKITGQTITCELPVPQPKTGGLDLSLVNVVYTPSGKDSQAAVVKQDTSKACDAGAEGWQYIDGNSKIRLCGAICDTVRADAGAKVDVVLGCESVLE